jgi:predicted lipid-binding transport protein (Tim44 family)
MNPDTKPLIQSDANVTQPAWSQAERAPTEPAYVVMQHTTSYTTPQQAPKQPDQPKKRGGLMGLLLVGMLVLGMLLGGAGAGAVMLVGNAVNPPVASAPVTTNPSAATGTGSSTLVALLT